jgi:hypothetical protein
MPDRHGAAGVAGTAPVVGFGAAVGGGCESADALQKPHATSHGAPADAAKLAKPGVVGVAGIAPAGFCGAAEGRCEIAGAPLKPHAEPADTSAGHREIDPVGRLTRWSPGIGEAPLCVMPTGGPAVTELDRHERERLQRGAVWPVAGGLRARLLGSTSLNGNAVGVTVSGGMPALIEAVAAGGDVRAAIARLCRQGRG